MLLFGRKIQYYILKHFGFCLFVGDSILSCFFLAQPGDAGVFTCVATNPAGSVRQDVHLSINTRPVFKELPGDVTLNKGQSLVLSCHAQGTPPPTIFWTVNSRPFTGTVLCFSIFSLEDVQHFLCAVTYNSQFFILTLVFDTSNVTVFVDKTSCCALIHLTALMKSVSGAAVDEAGRSAVIIENVTVSDAGTYVCLAENSVGSIRALAFVRIRGEPFLYEFLWFICYKITSFIHIIL